MAEIRTEEIKSEKDKSEEIETVGKEEQKEPAYYNMRPVIGKKGPSKLRQQFGKGMTYFLVVAACIVFYFALLRFTDISKLVGMVFGVLKPVVYGCVIAYLLNPIVKKVDKYFLPVLEKKMQNKEKACKL